MHYQSIVSLRQRAVVGLEALARGRSSEGQSIPPAELFRRARESSQSVELEHVCRREAIAGFSRLAERGDGRTLLFLNLDIAVSGVEERAEDLAVMAKAAGLPPSRIVLEIVESRVADSDALTAFVDRQREAGFLIALDDVGAGHSNLRRVALLKPDLLKIDRSLVQGLDEDYHRQEAVRSLVQLGRRIGALVVAEGVERFEEVVAASMLGADYLQGFHLARPSPSPELAYPGHLEAAGTAYRERRSETAAAERARFQQGRAMVLCLQEACAGVRSGRFDDVLATHVNRNDLIDSAYVLDASGVQLSRTVGPRKGDGREHPLFLPAQPGTNHALKDYYLRAAHGGGLQVTEPYISLATGRLCITMALAFSCSQDGAPYILCVDLISP